jgi:hypothetical protein
LDALELSKESVGEFPTEGYSPDEVKSNGRTHRRAKKLYNEIIEVVNAVFCIEESSLCPAHFNRQRWH